ncbi:MAG: hypothetical protein EBZ59_04760 [Planctomycetia bacterium]|nr:hypothetical protein [Planctomycetia bacterium]
MRDNLVGYLLGALEEPEMRQIDSALADPAKRQAVERDLAALRLAAGPLARDRDHIAPPPGLAGRTLAFIAANPAGTAVVSGSRPIPMPRSFTPESAAGRIVGPRVWFERAVMAATALAAAILVGPLVLDSIQDSRARRAERSLQRASAALQDYAEAHRVFPTPPGSGPLSRAGLYAPTLVSEGRLVADDGTLLCPGSSLARRGTFRVPTLDELKAAVGTPQFDEMVRSMGGDYGYTLGHRDASGELQPYENLRRPHHPIMSDAPGDDEEKSSNHAGGIHHVLFELPDDIRTGDHIFRNHKGEVAAGVDSEDAVIGDSHDQP